MFKKTILITSLTALAACGGGGGSSSSSDVKAGKIDALAGVDYRTETQSGTLNSSGEFNYKEGESLTLLIGDTVIAETQAAAEIRLVKLLALDELPTTPLAVRSALRMPEYTRERIETGYLIEKTVGQYNQLHNTSNVMRLLIALDNDNDSSNGFDITANSAAVVGLKLNFDVSLYEFSANDDALAFQHSSGISLAMDAARPLRDAYDLADIDITVAERVTQEGVGSLSYTAFGQVATRTDDRSSSSITEYTYTYSAENGEMLIEQYATEQKSNAIKHLSSRQLNTKTYNNFGLLNSDRAEIFVRGNTTELATYDIQTNSYMDDKVYLTTERTVEYSDAAGTVDNSYSVRKTYNDVKKRTSSANFSGDTTDQEVFEYGTKSYLYDSESRLTKTEYENLNSNTQSSFEYTYSENAGSLISTRTYNRSNGTKEEIKEIISSEGLLTAKETKAIDGGGLVTFIESMTYVYDDQGRISECRSQSDSNGDGTANSTATSNLVYTAAGLSNIKNIYDSNADGTADSETDLSVTYGDNGEVTIDKYGNVFTYGNAAQNGISYLIYEYKAPALGGDTYLYFYDNNVKCETASTHPHA
jgi:hypothetical protein